MGMGVEWCWVGVGHWETLIRCWISSCYSFLGCGDKQALSPPQGMNLEGEIVGPRHVQYLMLNNFLLFLFSVRTDTSVNVELQGPVKEEVPSVEEPPKPSTPPPKSGEVSLPALQQCIRKIREGPPCLASICFYTFINAYQGWVTVTGRGVFLFQFSLIRRGDGSLDRSFMGWTHWAISRSSQCSTTGVTKAVVCVFLSVGWCI